MSSNEIPRIYILQCPHCHREHTIEKKSVVTALSNGDTFSCHGCGLESYAIAARVSGDFSEFEMRALGKNGAPKKEVPSNLATSTQVGGNHYKNFMIQPIEFIEKNSLSFCQGNVIKYVTRYKFKNGLEDLKKAKHYIDLLIEMEGLDE